MAFGGMPMTFTPPPRATSIDQMISWYFTVGITLHEEDLLRARIVDLLELRRELVLGVRGPC